MGTSFQNPVGYRPGYLPYSAPAYPAAPQPAYGSPAYGSPAYGSPAYGSPGYAAPAYTGARPTAYASPAASAPAYVPTTYRSAAYAPPTAYAPRPAYAAAAYPGYAPYGAQPGYRPAATTPAPYGPGYRPAGTAPTGYRPMGAPTGVNGITGAAPTRPISAASPTVSVGAQVLTHPTSGNHVELFVDSQGLEALAQMITNAKRSVQIETFVWHDDDTGRRVADLLIAKRRQGLDVKVLIDKVGLGFTSETTVDAAIIQRLQNGGVDARVFNGGISLANGIVVTHRKIYTADDEVAMTGGQNIGDEYVRQWHDLLFSIRGPEVQRILGEFYTNWVKAGGQPPLSVPAVPPVYGGTAQAQVVVTSPGSGKTELEQATYGAIDLARTNIQMMTPYLSDTGLVARLAAAARRGVRVQVILPGTRQAGTNGFIYSYLNREEARTLVKAGVDVRWYDGGVVAGKAVKRFSHSKILLVDQDLASVGSGNGDARTFHDNYELNLLVRDPSFLAQVRSRLWNVDYAQTRPATPQDLESDNFLSRAFERLLAWFEGWL